MNAPSHVVHLIYALSTGGLENGLVNIINRMPAKRYRHTIVCLTSADDFSQRITAPGVDVIALGKPPGHDLGFYLNLRQTIKQLNPDIVHSRNLAALEAQLSTLWMGGIKRVHGEHGREVGDLDGTNRKYLLLRRSMRWLIHHYIAVSADLQRWLMETVGVEPQRVTQIYNGVDAAKFKPRNVKPLALLPQRWRDLDDMLLVGTVGRLTPVKDQQLLLEAVAQIRSIEPQLFQRLRLIIVGDGPLRANLVALAEQLELTDFVWFAGDRSDVPEVLSTMDLFVLPSLGEGISNTILEAMASGLPVVATAVGGNLELVQEAVTGALVPAGDSSALAGAICNMLRDVAALDAAGANAQRYVADKFDWDRTVAQYMRVYDDLLQQ